MKCLMSLLMFVIFTAVASMQAQTPDRSHLQEKIMSLRSELKSYEDQHLSPSPADIEAHADFLSQPQTGLIRLMPREVFDKPEKMTVRGGGAYYSFTRLTHEYGYGSDIELSRDEFSVGFAGANYGMIAVLSDATVDSVTLGHPAAQYLAAHKPPFKLADARVEQRRTSEGIIENGFSYRRRAPAVVGQTYILRSIGYDTSDVLVCFQALRKDEDGSWILAWRLLREYEKPKLERVTEEK
jgi:hypothetical protein